MLREQPLKIIRTANMGASLQYNTAGMIFHCLFENTKVNFDLNHRYYNGVDYRGIDILFRNLLSKETRIQ